MYGPPSALAVSSGVRRSTSTRACPLLSSRDAVGSVVIPAWMTPRFMAEMKSSPVPAGTKVTWLSFRPAESTR